MAVKGAKVEGVGTAGTPVGGVLTVQGSGTLGAFEPTASGDGVPDNAMGASGTYVYDPATGTWNRARQVQAAGAVAPLGYPAHAIVSRNNAGNFSPVDDWTRGDGVGTAGFIAVGPELLNGAGNTDRQRGDQFGGARVAPAPALGHADVVGGANAIATCTLPAPGANLFQFITHIRIARVATAALAGGALLAVTTTNLGGRQWRTGSVMSITVGQPDPTILMDQEFTHPIRAAVANTAVTIVGPAAGAAVSWDISVDYYNATL